MGNADMERVLTRAETRGDKIYEKKAKTKLQPMRDTFKLARRTRMDKFTIAVRKKLSGQ